MKNFKRIIFSGAKAIIKLFYRKPEFIGTENLPSEPCVIIGNHTQMNGPLIGELYFPNEPYIWCAAQMMHLKEVPAYSYRDFWSRKPKCLKWLYKLLSYLIAPLSVFIFNEARTIAVYHDKRVISTFKESIRRLNDGKSIVIYPEHDKPYNHILCDFQEGFVDVARLYHKQTGKALRFVPIYIAPKLKKVCIGKSIRFDPDAPSKEERKRICEYLMREISDIATALPRHKVIPYNNVSKKEYRYNK